MKKQEKNLSGRTLIKSILTIALGSLLGCTPANTNALPTAVPFSERNYRGSDFEGWEVVVGDGVYNAPGEVPVNDEDIETENYGGYSEIRANLRQRRIMAHNITFKRIIDDHAFDFVHTCSYKFRLPYLPDTSNQDLNGQTIEGGMFLWDGGKTRLDYGLAFQWNINPREINFGKIFYWTGDQWAYAGYLEPDLAWHEIEMVFDFKNETTALLIDGNPYPSRFTKTTKPETWGVETAARLQAEIISSYPGEQGIGYLHKAQFKDWNWTWEPYRTAFPPVVLN